jgi:hypothetical protein
MSKDKKFEALYEDVEQVESYIAEAIGRYTDKEDGHLTAVEIRDMFTETISNLEHDIRKLKEFKARWKELTLGGR